MSTLPIESALPELRAALVSAGAAVLQAPPGAGKTTHVPLALLDEPWLAGRRIVMLEPRRLAARAAATFMARALGQDVGGTVGYRVRMETRVGPTTRIEVVTEGVLTRMLQSDAALEGVGLVIFDEFHERSLHADLGLALTLQSRALLRDDLRVLVMSATLDGGPVAALLGDAPVVTSLGRSFPVDVRYLPHRVEGRMEGAVVRVVRDAVNASDGDVLVFLPGAGEIHRVEEMLRDADLPSSVRVTPLYGNLPQSAQDEAIAPSPPGRRKVVLSTSIAETSLTIEGVRVVIDSGLMRVPRFSPRTGMTRLETTTVSRASAEQRAGRAGRVAPGVCWRMWPEAAQAGLVPHSTPEILDADLAPLALELAAWGVADPAELAWLDPPPAAAFAQARELLAELGALDRAGAVTAHGRRMAGLPLHPRLAHMALRARELGLGGLACDLAALLSERDPFRRGDGPPDADLRLRLEALRDLAGNRRVRASADVGALRRVMAEAREWRRRLGVRGEEGDVQSAGLLLALAYPDRIGQRRTGRPGRYRLRNGRGAALAEGDPLAASPYLVAPELDGTGRESRVYLAAPVELDEVERHFADQVETEEAVAWDADAKAVRARRRVRLGALVLREAPLADPDPDLVTTALLEAIAGAGLDALPWSKASAQLRERMALMHRHDPSWPDVSDAALAEELADWLGPYVYGLTKWDEVQRLDLTDILLNLLGWERRTALDTLVPSHLEVPSGSRIPIDYADPDAPVLAARLQELFGMTETPRVAGGRVPLVIHLLSPAHRPVQVTRDLASFWKTGYFEVKKDLKGRYPKHYWPDDPLQAQATSRVRPRPAT
ncbi:ATP-dependent helicase HrpB [Longimicrobium sp.]|uniref:ATP-dependent helicase HrpB n=1 Tax=Longimicrobium sp. TaxID=2029185 RepID=UPI002E307761|nr:ATP-dependent helicase HrpB [Longimicrobium sp.]HEX6041564.1 ATP-dependent helicase HrpB [Longimicrobium sp.]